LTNPSICRQFGRLATCFNAGFLLGSFFDPEDGGDIFIRGKSVDFQRATLHYITEVGDISDNKKVAGSIADEVNGLFPVDLILPAALWP
jgi:hypothetical protein